MKPQIVVLYGLASSGKTSTIKVVSCKVVA